MSLIKPRRHRDESLDDVRTAAIAEIDTDIKMRSRAIELTRACMERENDRDEQLAVLQEAIVRSHIEIAADNPCVDVLVTAYRDYAASIRAHARATMERMEYEIELAKWSIAALREQRKRYEDAKAK